MKEHTTSTAIERSRYRGVSGEVCRLASCLRGFGRHNPLSNRRFSDGRDEPSAPSHDRGHDGPQPVASDPAILHQRGFEVQPLLYATAEVAMNVSFAQRPL